MSGWGGEGDKEVVDAGEEGVLIVVSAEETEEAGWVDELGVVKKIGSSLAVVRMGNEIELELEDGATGLDV